MAFPRKYKKLIETEKEDALKQRGLPLTCDVFGP